MSYNGTVQRGTPTFAAGKFGNAFAGGGVYKITGLPSASTVGAFECWIKTTSTTGLFIFLGSDSTGGPYLAINNGALAYQRPSGSLNTTSTNINDGAWHHVALTFDGSITRAFADGVLLGGQAATAVVNLASMGIGGFPSTATYDIPAGTMIDEVRISSTTRYTATFTAPTTALTDDANTVALYHLESDATDSHVVGATAPGQVTGLTATAGNTQVALAWTAPSDGGAAITDYLVEYQPSGGSWATFADGTSTATTATVTGLTNGTAYLFRVSAINSVGTGTASATASATPATSSSSIAPTDTNIVYSPYNWLVTTGTAKTINAGAYLRCLIAGSPTAITANFDVSNMASPASQIAYRVDGGAWTQTAVAATVALTMPSSGAAWARHTVEIVVKSTTETANRWNSPQNTAVVFTGFTCAGTSSAATVVIQKRGLNVAVFGDSITEGVRVINSTATNDTDRNDAMLGWAYRLLDHLGAEVGVIGFGATGVDTAGTGNVPAATTSYSLLWSGQARTWTPTPDLIVINLGANGGTQAGYTTLLNSLLAATPATTLIAAVRPFGAQQAANVAAAVAGCNTPSRVKYIDTTGWWDSSDSSDSLHPYGDQNITKLAPYLAAALRTFLARGAQYLKKSDGSLKLINPVRL